jgi:hypothetical protein
MNHQSLPEIPATPDAKKEKVASISPNVKVTLSDGPTNLAMHESALLYHYALLMYNFCS